MWVYLQKIIIETKTSKRLKDLGGLKTSKYYGIKR